MLDDGKPLPEYPEAHDFFRRDYKEVSAELDKRGTRFRRSRVDGNPCVCTRDYVPERWNFDIEDGIIVRATTG